MKNIQFTENQRSGIIHFLKIRIKNIIGIYSDGSEASVKWKKVNYKPVLTAMLKLEDENEEGFSEDEILTIISCIKESAPTEELINEMGFKYNKIKEPFLSIINVL